MFADGVIEGSSTTGTNDYVLTGAVLSGRTFGQEFSSGARVAYWAQTKDRTKWEMVEGLYNVSGSIRTLTRATVLKSSNAGAKIDWQPVDAYYVFSIAPADVLSGLMAGSLAASRPWWIVTGGRWWKSVVGGWEETIYDGTNDVVIGFYDTTNAIYFSRARKSTTAVGAANKTFAVTDNGLFTFDTAAGARTATLPAGSTVKDGYRLELKGLSAANGIILTPDAGDGIDGGADAATKTVPGAVQFTLTWSTASDMWITNYIAPALPVYPIGTIGGLTYANNGSDAANDINIVAGGCMDATGAYWMSYSGTLIKRADAAWTVGTNQGALDTGSVADTDYFIWAIARSDTGVTDILFSTSATAPTMPANYNYKRLIGWFRRASSTNIAFVTRESAGGGLAFRWSAPTLDVNSATTLGTTRVLSVVKVPVGFAVEALITVGMTHSAIFLARVCSPSEANGAPSGTAVPLANLAQPLNASSNPVVADFNILTNQAAQIAARATLTIDLYTVQTTGWNWTRR